MNTRYAVVIGALLLVGTVQSVAAEERIQEDCKFTRAAFEMTLPCEWKAPQESAGEEDPIVIDLDDDAGHLRIYFSEETASLKKIARKMRKTARVERWKLRSRRRVRIDGNRALATLVDIRKGALKTRQLFYFFNVDDGRYILQFGAHSKRFDYRRYRQVAASFKRRIQSAQPTLLQAPESSIQRVVDTMFLPNFKTEGRRFNMQKQATAGASGLMGLGVLPPEPSFDDIR